MSAVGAHPFRALKRRQLSPPLQALLGSENVWCDSRTEEGSQKFVLWAGCVLERRCATFLFNSIDALQREEIQQSSLIVSQFPLPRGQQH